MLFFHFFKRASILLLYFNHFQEILLGLLRKYLLILKKSYSLLLHNSIMVESLLTENYSNQKVSERSSELSSNVCDERILETINNISCKEVETITNQARPQNEMLISGSETDVLEVKKSSRDSIRVSTDYSVKILLLLHQKHGVL